MSLLHALHKACAPRIILSLRIQDPVPDWITHIALVRGSAVTGEKAAVLANLEDKFEDGGFIPQPDILAQPTHAAHDAQRAVLVDLQGVNVSYHTRQVRPLGFNLALLDMTEPLKILKNINWTIRKGDKWLLRGPNGQLTYFCFTCSINSASGSGKTTLLSMITGDVSSSRNACHCHIPTILIASSIIHATTPSPFWHVTKTPGHAHDRSTHRDMFTRTLQRVSSSLRLPGSDRARRDCIRL